MPIPTRPYASSAQITPLLSSAQNEFKGSTGGSHRAVLSASKPTDEYVTATPHFKQFLALLISDVPVARSLVIHQEKNLLRVFIVVDQFDFDANEQIYDREEHIMDVFRGFHFDFHITCQSNFGDPDLKTVWVRQ